MTCWTYIKKVSKTSHLGIYKIDYSKLISSLYYSLAVNKVLGNNQYFNNKDKPGNTCKDVKCVIIAVFNKPCKLIFACWTAAVFSPAEILASPHSERFHLLKSPHCPVFVKRQVQQLQYIIWAHDGSNFQLYECIVILLSV